MKLLSIVGSPRLNGNTHFLAKTFCESAARAGFEVKEVFLNHKKIHGCNHCDGCRQTGVCSIKDDMAGIIQQMRASDAFLLSTPVYCFSVTAQMKAFFDRTWAMTKPTWDTGVEGKPVFFIVGCAAPLREGPDYVLHHKMTMETAIRVSRMAKLAQGLPLKEAIDPWAPFDATADTLRLLYQFSGILGLEPLGHIAAEGLGHDKEAVRKRPPEIERAVMCGAKFASVAEMLKNKVYL